MGYGLLKLRHDGKRKAVNAEYSYLRSLIIEYYFPSPHSFFIHYSLFFIPLKSVSVPSHLLLPAFQSG